jgi:2,3-bisphosphoglycerate-independent phosphoglycerate mutase
VVDVLVIPDGAGDAALRAARMPVLGALARDGAVVRVVTTPEGCPAGSETGIPALLGAPLARRVSRGLVDAAAHGIEVPPGMTAWRADLVYGDGRRASVRQARDVCAHLRPGAHAIGGHRLLLLSTTRPEDRRLLGLRVRVWPDGEHLCGPLPAATTLVCARGAAAGCGRLLGAQVVIPDGATGDIDTDLSAKAHAAVAAIAGGATRVVVHVGGPDEAAHRRDAAAVVGALERMDVELLAPLRDVVAVQDGRLAVCPDHGTDPKTGTHDATPVSAVVWGPGAEALSGVVTPDALFAGAVAA